MVISYTVDKLLTDSAWEKSYSMRVGAGGATEPTTPAWAPFVFVGDGGAP